MFVDRERAPSPAQRIDMFVGREQPQSLAPKDRFPLKEIRGLLQPARACWRAGARCGIPLCRPENDRGRNQEEDLYGVAQKA